jgi:hypothetical protein
VGSNSHRYAYVDDYGNWSQAVAKAEALTCCGARGHLATISSAEEDSFVADALNVSGYINVGWIGINRIGAGANITWSHGNYTEAFNTQGYSNWFLNDTAGDFFGSYYAWTWKAVASSLNVTLPYVVEFDCPGPAATQPPTHPRTTAAPGSPPALRPTRRPTIPPSQPPAKPPTQPPACARGDYRLLTRGPGGTVAWRTLARGGSYCVPHPYNVRVRAACPAPIKPAYPVTIELRSGSGALVRRHHEYAEPYLLWGSDGNRTGPALGPSSLLSPRKLAKGWYTLRSAVGGVLRFRQVC